MWEPQAGASTDPVTLVGVTGSDNRPRKITGPGTVPKHLANLGKPGFDPNGYPKLKPKHAVLTSGRRFGIVRRELNREAQRAEASGLFPGLFRQAGDAMLTLTYCRNLLIENIHFEDCWPTAIFLDNCQRIVIRNCAFFGGTFAIVARGSKTRDIVVENCFWEQDDFARRDRVHGGAPVAPTSDPKAHDAIWNGFSWAQIHADWAAEEPRFVDVEADARGYDGDFFRSFGVAGNLVFRGNHIRDAFNGIHTFGTETGAVETPTRNVLIEKNLFVRVRDNCVEPETGARNWVVRHNMLLDTYRPFSFEGERTGWIYIYGNLGANVSRIGPQGDPNAGGSLFKFGEGTKADGPTLFAHNTWRWSLDIAKKYGLDHLHFVNNAIARPIAKTVFGKEWAAQARDKPGFAADKDAVTKRLVERGMRFENNIVQSPALDPNTGCNLHHFPDELVDRGYALGQGNSGRDPMLAMGTEELAPSSLRPAEGSPMSGSSTRFETLLPTGERWVGEGKLDIGAWQGESLFRFEAEFPFIAGMFGAAAGQWTGSDQSEMPTA